MEEQHRRMFHLDERHNAIYTAAAAGMNRTSTNPSPQAQFLATQSAREGFDAGLALAASVMLDLAQFEQDSKKLVAWFIKEMANYSADNQEDGE